MHRGAWTGVQWYMEVCRGAQWYVQRCVGEQRYAEVHRRLQRCTDVCGGIIEVHGGVWRCKEVDRVVWR